MAAAISHPCTHLLDLLVGLRLDGLPDLGRAERLAPVCRGQDVE